MPEPRTPATDDGDDAENTTGADRDAGAEEREGEQGEEKTDWKALALKYKGSAERANQLEDRLKKLEEEGAGSFGQPPAVADDTPKPRQVNRPKLEFLADRGDEAAIAALAALDALDTNQQQQVIIEQLRDIPEKTERQRVYAHWLKNRHRFGDIAAAKADLDNPVLTDKLTKAEAEAKRLKEALELAHKTPPRDVVRTHRREVPASEHKTRKMSRAEFDREVEDLHADGRPYSAMQLQQELADDKIELTD